MYEINPFPPRQTLKVVESSPARSTTRGDIRALVFGAKLATKPKAVDAEGIARLLDSVPHPDRVELLEVDYDSRLRTLPDFSRFANVAYAHIAGRSIQDHQAVAEFSRLKNLFLVGFKGSDLAAFARHRLSDLRLVRGKTESLSVTANNALLQQCTHLHDLRGSSIESLTLETCNKISFPSLARVERLAHLQLLGCRHLTKFSWVKRCQSLKHLVVAATPSSQLELRGLKRSTLERLFLSVPNKLVAEVSRTCPTTAVSNGDVWYLGGEPGVGDDPMLENG